jgi:hypothetical protein
MDGSAVDVDIWATSGWKVVNEMCGVEVVVVAVVAMSWGRRRG